MSPGALSVLYIDDNRDDLALLAVSARHSGRPFQIHTVASVPQGVDYLQGLGQYADRAAFPLPEVILIDWLLPLLEGRDFLQWLKTSAFKDIPVMVLSSKTDEREAALAAGAERFLAKPFRHERLEGLMTEIWDFAMEKRRQRAPTEVRS